MFLEHFLSKQGKVGRDEQAIILNSYKSTTFNIIDQNWVKNTSLTTALINEICLIRKSIFTKY